MNHIIIPTSLLIITFLTVDLKYAGYILFLDFGVVHGTENNKTGIISCQTNSWLLGSKQK